MERNITLTAVYEPCATGGYLAYIEEIDGINSQGETLEEAKENLIDAINLVFEEAREKYQISSPSENVIKRSVTITL